MKTVAIAITAAGLAISAAQAQPVTTGAGNVCIKTDWIDHTKAPDNRTLLFYMRDNKVWRTTLVHECPLLPINGFIYAPAPPDEICGNLQAIKVIGTGMVCQMGPILPYTKAGQGS